MLPSDGLWLLVVRKGQAFVPTMAKTVAGFYLGISPVAVVDCRSRALVEDALMRAIDQGNPRVPTPSRDNFPKDPVLEASGVRSTAAFEKYAQSWSVSRHPDGYRITPYKQGLEARDRQRLLPVETPLDVVVRRAVELAVES